MRGAVVIRQMKLPAVSSYAVRDPVWIQPLHLEAQVPSSLQRKHLIYRGVREGRCKLKTIKVFRGPQQKNQGSSLRKHPKQMGVRQGEAKVSGSS